MRLLICAPSNGAVDEIARRLLRDEDFLKKKRNLVRIGMKGQVHKDVLEYLLDTFSGDTIPTQEAKLGSADVIVSTLNSVQQLAMKKFELHRDYFRCIIVDEASQCAEPELLMQLVYQSKKLILIGDHKQLPATVISSFAQKFGYGRSMFERLYSHFETNNNDEPIPVRTLTTQYRMHEEIVAFPSARFYDNQLETPPETGGNPLLSTFKPYTVFDLAYSQESNTTASKCNIAEATFITRLVLMILDKLGFDWRKKKNDKGKSPVKPNRYKGNKNQQQTMKVEEGEERNSENTNVQDKSEKETEEAEESKKQQEEEGKEKEVEESPKLPISIGIITFYRGQKTELIRRFRQVNSDLLRLIDINTVDAFQGQERDIVILSCVRAFDPDNGHNSVGFLRSEQRMNVALTRAKSAMYICTHEATFANVPHWGELIVDAKEKDKFVSIPSSNITHETLIEMITA